MQGKENTYYFPLEDYQRILTVQGKCIRKAVTY